MFVPETSETPSADEVLDLFEEIILSGVTISAAFNHPLHLTEAGSPAPFALRIIEAAGRRGLSQAALAKSLNRSAPWTTRLVDNLERDSLIIRTAHPSDRRINMLTLSSLGHDALQNFVERGRGAMMRLFPSQTQMSLSQFRGALNQFNRLVSARNSSDAGPFKTE